MDGGPVHPMLVAERLDVPQADKGFLVKMPFVILALSRADHPLAAVKNDFPPRTAGHLDNDFEGEQMIRIRFQHFHLNDLWV